MMIFLLESETIYILKLALLLHLAVVLIVVRPCHGELKSLKLFVIVFVPIAAI